MDKLFPCACCGNLTMSEPPGSGSYEICPVCFWEDDPVQFENPSHEGGANRVSLEQARRNYLDFGAISQEFINEVRPPLESEQPKNTVSGENADDI